MSEPAIVQSLPPLPAADAPAQERGRAVMARWVARHGAPTLEHFRRVYEQAGLEWPGEEEIRRRHLVAPAPSRSGGSAV